MGDSLASQFAALRARLERVRCRDRLPLREQLEALWPPRNPAAVAQKLARLAEAIEASAAEVARRRAILPAPNCPEELPIAARRDEIVAHLRLDSVLVLAGETGSGKSTQLPKLCLEAGLGAAGLIGCTQPRRVAATSVSRRVAEELGVGWGREVGCKIRFADRTGPETVIKFMTDGILLAELQSDPLLQDYEVIIIDEAHERSLNIDFLLGALRALRERRTDLKIIITSATIDTARFAEAFGGAPIMEVSGRMYPVEVVYRPLEDVLIETGEENFVEGVAAVVEEICTTHRRERGDVLVFLPGEREIREARKLLEGRNLGELNILPLFGRLAAADQDRIFAPTRQRKVVLSTNLAETSLTIPGIRYVVDCGLARVPRYSSQSRTQRLPVEPIARSSADQRKGRCGRVAEGVCYRLYSEADYLGRPAFATPEIQRANLAAVILRMLAANLGDPAIFPFLDPPSPTAIRGGYALLHELGAIDEERNLTDLGRELAQLPVDPTVGRMLLQARHEGCVPEVLVIGAALSIQDPRERPMDKAEEADRMHRKFVHPESDFLTLLNLWEAYHDAVEELSQRRLREYCSAHFLNYLRMREWRDLHDQLAEAMEDLGPWQAGHAKAEYHQIHRAIVAGLVGHVARRDQGHQYKATHSRTVMLFPGSGLFRRDDAKPKKKPGETPAPDKKPKLPEWLVAGEIAETSRVYARTVARIDPRWILEFAAHLLRHTYGEPIWDADNGRVIAREQVLLYGLEVETRSVAYERFDPAAATQVFLQQGLIEDTITEVVPVLEHNRAIVRQIQDWQTRLRRINSHALEERLAAWYAERLPPGIGSVASLRKLLKEKHVAGEPDFLKLKLEDLAEPGAKPDERAFPDAVEAQGARLELAYEYLPGDPRDGVTLQVPLADFSKLNGAVLDWAVPAYRAEVVETLLRSLPKETRKALFPIGEKTPVILGALQNRGRPLTEELTGIIAAKFGVQVPLAEWNLEAVPPYLRPRVAVVDKTGRPLAEGRDWQTVATAAAARIRAETRAEAGPDPSALWQAGRARWERTGLTAWPPELPTWPESLVLGDLAGVPVVAWPGLVAAPDGTAAVKLFASRDEADAASRGGLAALLGQAVRYGLAWLQRDLTKELARAQLLAIGLTTADALRAEADAALTAYVLAVEGETVLPLRLDDFRRRAAEAEARTKGVVPKLVDVVVEVLNRRRLLLAQTKTVPWLAAELARLVPPNFVAQAGWPALTEWPRYLEALRRRAERFAAAPPRDAEKARLVEPFAKALAAHETTLAKAPAAPATTARRQALRDFRLLLEEYRVSVFAQELGTRQPVSPKRLEERLRSVV